MKTNLRVSGRAASTLLLLALAGCAGEAAPAPSEQESSPLPIPAGHQPGEEAAVLAAMDAYLRAIATNDVANLIPLQTADGMTYRARALPEGGMDVVGNSNAYWTDPARNDGSTNRERYWSPTVLIRGSIAVVWAPYEYQLNGKTSHCGVDVFSFIKRDGKWIVSNSTWTVEPDACPSLRPADPSIIRPAE